LQFFSGLVRFIFQISGARLLERFAASLGALAVVLLTALPPEFSSRLK